MAGSGSNRETRSTGKLMGPGDHRMLTWLLWVLLAFATADLVVSSRVVDVLRVTVIAYALIHTIRDR